MTTSPHGPLRVGVGGPVGTGKTALMDALCKTLRDRYDIAAITNDIYTKEDAEFLTRAGSLPPERILGIETGGCPHTAIREDASINLAGVAELYRRFPGLDLILIESGGDNLAAKPHSEGRASLNAPAGRRRRRSRSDSLPRWREHRPRACGPCRRRRRPA